MIYVDTVQVQLQLQQATGSSAVVPKLGRLNSKSPARRGLTKHRPFHLSESPWTSLSSGSAPLGHSQALPSAPGSPSSLRNTRPLSETPIRTARSERFASDKQATASQKKAKESQVNGRSPNKRLAERQSGRVERQNVLSVSSTADEGSQRGHSPDVMSFGSYGGVSFSSFAPALPTDAAGAAGLGTEEDNGECASAQACQHHRYVTCCTSVALSANMSQTMQLCYFASGQSSLYPLFCMA